MEVRERGGVWRWGIMDVGECGGDGVRRWEMEEFGSRGVKVREVEVKECGGDRVWRWKSVEVRVWRWQSVKVRVWRWGSVEVRVWRWDNVEVGSVEGGSV